MARVLAWGRTVSKVSIVRTDRHSERAATMAKAHPKLVTPTAVKRTVMPTRRANARVADARVSDRA